MKKLILLLLLITFTSCKYDNNSSSEDETELTTTDEDGNEVYPDGTYCAEVDYYNPNTGTNSTYTLNVEVENNELTVIHWPNGGWLDESHFTPEELDSSGSCSFTSDQGYEYKVQITGPECNFTDEAAKSYTFNECSEILNLTEEERENCLVHYEENEILNEQEFKILKQFVSNLRKIESEYAKKVNNLNNMSTSINNEINEGYILNIKTTKLNDRTSQLITISKRGVKYLFEVDGNSKCSMGTANFDENNYGWQIVTVKESPNDDSVKGYNMKIIDKGF